MLSYSTGNLGTGSGKRRRRREGWSEAISKALYFLLTQRTNFYSSLGIHRSPSPPLNTTWVLVIIVAELTVACVIGISCMVFSCRMLKKLRREEVRGAGSEGMLERRTAHN